VPRELVKMCQIKGSCCYQKVALLVNTNILCKFVYKMCMLCVHDALCFVYTMPSAALKERFSSSVYTFSKSAII